MVSFVWILAGLSDIAVLARQLKQEARHFNMAAYDKYSRYYDAIKGSRRQELALIRKLISKYNRHAKKVLEIACGTGALLKELSRKYDVCGLDISGPMLEIAKKQAPRAKLFRQDMTTFKLDDRFDVILCIFNSINHLLSFDKWKKTFKRAYEHLNCGGIFIFDMNTKRALKTLIEERFSFHRIQRDFIITECGSGGDGVMNFNIKMFEHKGHNRYLLSEENIKEISFSVRDAADFLNGIYSRVKVLGPGNTAFPFSQ